MGATNFFEEIVTVSQYMMVIYQNYDFTAHSSGSQYIETLQIGAYMPRLYTYTSLYSRYLFDFLLQRPLAITELTQFTAQNVPIYF